MECLSKHTKDATALRGSYKIKSAEVATIMVAAGYAMGWPAGLSPGSTCMCKEDSLPQPS